jgi:SnoaL-like domain
MTRLLAAAAAAAVSLACAAALTAAAATARPGLEVPPAVQRYIDGVNNNDLDRLVGSFAPDGMVIDVSRRIPGRAAIRQWARTEVMGGRLRVIRVARNPWRRPGLTLLVRFAPAGSVGWDAYYRFVVRKARIAVADLQYA